MLPLALSAVGLGFVHGLGADHLMAIAALAVDGRDRRRTRVIRTALGFALGHTILLGLGVMAALALGVTLPESATANAERLGGVLLIVVGALGIWGVATGRAWSHVHRVQDGNARWHLHLGREHEVHMHSALPTAMGAVFAASSLRALMLLEPFGPAVSGLSLAAVLGLTALFGVGILLSMSIFGVLLARVLSARALARVGHGAALAVAVASVGLGFYWITSA